LWDVRATWADPRAYDEAAHDLAERFAANFESFEAQATEEMKAGAPKLTASQDV
jgi:phosphoenolpyruvate carboxykinase (ATP)